MMVQRFIVACLLTLTAILPASAQILENNTAHALVMKGIDQTLRQDYDLAEQTFQSVIALGPEHPIGYLYIAGMMQARYNDYGDRFDDERYDSLLNTAERLAEPMIDDPRTAAAGHFYTGSARAFRSFTRSEQGNLPSGIYYGLAAGNSMEKCLAADPRFLQVKNILGSFYYWRSKMAWIPFVPDRTAEGIRMIMEAFEHPYEKHLASHNLMVILTEEKRYADAEKYGLLMLREYPGNRLFLWQMMSIYEKWGKQKELIDIVRRLLAASLGSPVTNRYTEATCRLKLARYALSLNDRTTARNELQAVTALRPMISRTKGDLRKKISQAEELLESIE